MAKQVTDRQGAVEIVASAAETHVDRLRAKFEEMFSKHLEGKEKLPDIGLVVLLIARRLRAANAILVEKSDAYDRELADDAEPRERRDKAVEALVAEIIDCREALDAAFGPAIVRELGLDGRTDPEPKALLAKAKRFETDLKDPKRKWPKAKRKGIQVNPKEWIDDIEAPVKALEQAQADVLRELREAQVASEEKARAMASNDDAFGRSANALSKIFALLTDDALAAKVRPSVRRPGRVEAEEPASEEVEGGDGSGGQGGGSATPQ